MVEKSPTILAGEAEGYELKLLRPPLLEDDDGAVIKKQLARRMDEDIDESRSRCPLVLKESLSNEFFYPQKEKDGSAVDLQFIVNHAADAGVIGYCRLNVWEDVYVHSVRRYTAQVVVVRSLCSFTFSNDVSIKSGIPVREIMRKKKERLGAAFPRVGKFVTEAIGYKLCKHFKVNKVIFIFTSYDSAIPDHIKNGSIKIDDAQLEDLDQLVTGGVKLLQRMVDTNFTGGSSVSDVDMLKNRLLYLRYMVFRYPGDAGGGRRRHRTLRNRRKRSNRTRRSKKHHSKK